jgi:AcrR family transcriptional regulator
MERPRSLHGAENKGRVHTSETDLDRKSEIYRKALDLFIKKGFDATPMSAIARVLGMSKANLYYYCPDK